MNEVRNHYLSHLACAARLSKYTKLHVKWCAIQPHIRQLVAFPGEHMDAHWLPSDLRKVGNCGQ